MSRSLKLAFAAAAVTIGFAASSVSAAPAGAGLGPVKGLPEASSMVEKSAWVRQCHRGRWGRVSCHLVWVKPHRHYGYYGHGHRYDHGHRYGQYRRNWIR